MNIIENEKDIKKPTGLVGLERVVFGNVQRIYEFHREYVQSNINLHSSRFFSSSTFLPQLEQCIENPDILGRLFTVSQNGSNKGNDEQISFAFPL